MNYDEDFYNICHVLYSYQYVKHYTELTEAITEWLYEHSAGIVSNIVVLLHDAQEIAVMDGTEILDINSLSKAYKNRMALLHGYIAPSVEKRKATTTIKKKADKVYEMAEIQNAEGETGHENLIALLVSQAKKNGTDIVKLLQENLIVMEVSV